MHTKVEVRAARPGLVKDFRVSGLEVRFALILCEYQGRSWGCTPWGRALAQDFRANRLEVGIALILCEH